jgi:hypothetical protein
MDKRPRGILAVDTVLLCLAMNPYRHLVKRWNWKAACLSACFRSTAILLANYSAGPAGAIGAMYAEACYRSLASGFHSAVNQAFRYACPIWVTSAVSMLLVPAVGESIDWIMHSVRGTQRISATIAVSLIITALSTLFELFAMRRGILIVGPNSRSLVHDLRKIPDLAVSFLSEGARILVFLLPRLKSGSTIKSNALNPSPASAQQTARSQ